MIPESLVENGERKLAQGNGIWVRASKGREYAHQDEKSV